MLRRSSAAFGLVILFWLAGCGPRPTATPTAEPTATVPPPSPVHRLRPTATLGPLSAVPSKKVPGIVVPASAELVAFSAASQGVAAQAEYSVPHLTPDEARDWFRRHMPEAGWGAPEEVDGALLFTHPSELSAQQAREGYRRSVLILFEAASEGVTVVINAEAGD